MSIIDPSSVSNSRYQCRTSFRIALLIATQRRRDKVTQYTAQLMLGVLEQRSAILEKHDSSSRVLAAVVLVSTQKQSTIDSRRTLDVGQSIAHARASPTRESWPPAARSTLLRAVPRRGVACLAPHIDPPWLESQAQSSGFHLIQPRPTMKTTWRSTYCSFLGVVALQLTGSMVLVEW